MGKRVGIVVLGDEVLSGEIRESNIAYLVPLLNGGGRRWSSARSSPTTCPPW